MNAILLLVVILFFGLRIVLLQQNDKLDVFEESCSQEATSVETFVIDETYTRNNTTAATSQKVPENSKERNKDLASPGKPGNHEINTCNSLKKFSSLQFTVTRLTKENVSF